MTHYFCEWSFFCRVSDFIVSSGGQMSAEMCQVTGGRCKVAGDRLQVTRDTCHVTYDMCFKQHMKSGT